METQHLVVWAYLDKLFDNVKGHKACDSLEHIQELVMDQLNSGVCVFYFTKTTGEIRKAKGTLHPQLIIGKLSPEEQLNMAYAVYIQHKFIEELRKPKEDRDPEIIDTYKTQSTNIYRIVLHAEEEVNKDAKKKERGRSADVQPFFDLEEMKWKSFNINNLIGMIEV